MRLLIPLKGFVDWNGGLDLIRLILAGIEAAETDSDLQLTIAIPRLATAHRALALLPTRIAVLAGRQRALRAASKSHLYKIAHEVASGRHVVVCGHSHGAITELAGRDGSQIVFPSTQVLDGCPVPWVAYIPDFQHVHLPHFFSAAERLQRDQHYRALAKRADGIVVNSHSAANDVQQFLGVPTERILAMPFAPYMQPHYLYLEPSAVQRKYRTGARYFIVCNHFWTHKDHATAFRAFAKLHQDGPRDGVQLILTGDTSDYRAPGHYAALMKLARELRIQNRLHVLGLIPKADQLALLRGSIALIQPTLCEGGPGGGAVYDALGLGVQSIVSDIPINREIDDREVLFFSAGDPADLYAKMGQVLARPRAERTEVELMQAGQLRLTNLGQSIIHYLSGHLSA